MVNESTTFIVDGEEVDAWGRPAGGSADEEVGYDSWTAKQLMAEIDNRNKSRDENTQIVVEGTGKGGKTLKSDAVKALQDDDEAYPEDEEEE